ncbi:MAG TPA: TrbI/VirB10 family protein [Thermoanaerobaculia bacterium]|nr:TrbI/VirB10 family protein [Thermoanaerobaculia bacterium]
MAESPVQAPSPPPARRLSRPAMGLVFLVIVLFVTTAALLITAPGPRIPRPPETNPLDRKPAEAGFLSNPPRRPAPQPESAEAARAESLLRAARDSRASGPGPLSLIPPGAPPEGSPALAGAPPRTPGAEGGGEPPPGVYRPYPFPAPSRPAPAEPVKPPSWQAAFSSSLLASATSPSVAGFPVPPGFTPPPVPSPGGQARETGPVEPGSSTPARSGPGPAGKVLNPRTLPAGTVVNAILLTALSTDLPGDAVAHVTADVYSPAGALVLPRGARLVGSYKNRVALGEHRLAVAWDRLLAGGKSYDLPGLPSTSPDGAAGLPGDVDLHTGLVFGRAALLSLIGAGSQLGQVRQSRLGASLGTGEVAAGSVAQQLSQAATEFLNRAVEVSPTIFVPAGTRLTVLLPYDLELN